MAQTKGKDNKKAAGSQESGSTPFIDASTAMDAFTDAKKWFRPYFEPLDEFWRIARNKPSDKIDPNLPRITDGTMSALALENPKRVIQQLATGIVSCDDHPDFAKIADLTHRRKLLPMYNRGGSALQKHWQMMTTAFTCGSATSYTFFTQTAGILHTDYSVPFRKDVYSEKGKVFAPDSNIGFMRAWYQKRDLESIIRRETAYMDQNPAHKSEWDLKRLQKFIDAGAKAKDAEQMTPAEKEKGDGNTGGYEVIHAFQKGKAGTFYSFSPLFDGGKPFRTKISKDPRGKLPLDFEYCNIDGSNPVGRGQIELSGGIQNLIDQQMQMFQFLTTLMMGPPLQVWGNLDQSRLKYRPNAIWEMGQNPNSTMVKPLDINNEAIANFQNNYGLLKSQIFNLNSSQDHSISASDGNPAQSKTQAGVQASESRLGVSDNYLRKQHETWFSDQAETSINIFFSEMVSNDTMKLKDDELKDVMKTDAKKYLKGDILTIPYKEINKISFQFQVDASSSEIKEDADNAEKLTEVLKIVQTSQNPTIAAAEPKLIKLIIDEIGAEGTDDLFPEEQKDANGNVIPAQGAGPDPNQIMQMVQQAVQQSLQQIKQANDKPLHEALGIKFETLSPDVQSQLIQQLFNITPQAPTATQRQLDQKDQELNIKAMDVASKHAIDTAKTSHQHAMDIHNAAQGAETAQQQHELAIAGQQQQGQLEQQKLAASQQQAQMQASQQGQSVSQNQNSDTQSAQVSQPGTPQQAGDAPVSPDEEQFAQALFHRGFNEQDVEQAIVMKRQGAPIQQIIQVLGGKYANAQ